VEAAVEDGPGVHELPLEHVGVGVVQPHCLVPRGDEEVVAVVGEAEVGDPVGGRVGELLAAAHSGWRGGGAHDGRRSRRRRRRDSKFERATDEASTRGRSMRSGRFKKILGNSGFEF